ncbi:MAG: ribonuclease P protein component [Candidatus Ozemobacteraceae bacterium]
MGRPTLRTKADFDRVFARNERFFRDGVGFYVHLADDVPLRYGFVTPKRFGKAVDRNRFRRRIRELIRGATAKFRGVEIVISAYKPYEGLSFELLKRTVEWALGRIGKMVRYRGVGAVRPQRCGQSEAVPTRSTESMRSADSTRSTVSAMATIDTSRVRISS